MISHFFVFPICQRTYFDTNIWLFFRITKYFANFFCGTGRNRTTMVWFSVRCIDQLCYRSISWSEWCRTTVVGTRIRSNTVILHSIVFFFVVEAGLKHAISALRGQWLNQFVYSTVLSLLSDSNQRPMGYDAIALPSWAKEAICRPTRTRTQKKRFGISHVTITSWACVNRAA